MKPTPVIIPEIEAQLAEALHKSPTMIRFYACRMALELELGRQMSPEEQLKLGSYVPKVHRRPR